jgi:hypothetical protein
MHAIADMLQYGRTENNVERFVFKREFTGSCLNKAQPRVTVFQEGCIFNAGDGQSVFMGIEQLEKIGFRQELIGRGADIQNPVSWLGVHACHEQIEYVLANAKRYPGSLAPQRMSDGKIVNSPGCHRSSPMMARANPYTMAWMPMPIPVMDAMTMRSVV